ncbi:MAG: Dabb family protein [Flavobacteriaceae bacterium]
MNSIADRISVLIILLIYSITIVVGYFFYERKPLSVTVTEKNEPALQHIVLIQFKENITEESLQAIENAAYALTQIPGVHNLNFGHNVSPEGFDRGFTHSLTMAFHTAKDRDSVYLPHPIHQEFGAVFAPNAAHFVVYDFWK